VTANGKKSVTSGLNCRRTSVLRLSRHPLYVILSDMVAIRNTGPLGVAVDSLNDRMLT
jgi:hypothetical protein